MIYNKETKDQNLNKDCVVELPIGTDIYQVRATFGLHVFLEKIWNEALSLENENKKPLLFFINRGIENEYQIPISELHYICSQIVYVWFKKPEQTGWFKKTEKPEQTNKTLELDNQTLLSHKLLYLSSLCQGGTEAGKKFLVLLATQKMLLRNLEKRQEKIINTTLSKSTNSNTLH